MIHIDRTTGERCAQCGATEPACGFETRLVIHQGAHPRTGRRDVLETAFTVCRGTRCGGDLQMGHEG